MATNCETAADNTGPLCTSNHSEPARRLVFVEEHCQLLSTVVAKRETGFVFLSSNRFTLEVDIAHTP